MEGFNLESKDVKMQSKNKFENIEKSKIKNIFIWSGITIFFALTLIATFYDLQINQALADVELGETATSNLFAIIFDVLGESVLYLFLAFSFSVVFWWCCYNIKNNWKILCQIILSVAMFFTYLICINKAISYLNAYQTLAINNDYFLIFSIFFASLLALLTIYSLKFVKKENISILLKFALIIICVATVSNLITQFSKVFVFGRMRFIAMNYIEDFSYYTPWYVLNGTGLKESLSFLSLPDEAFKSFPSGHTTAAGITFTLICLPLLFEKLKKYKLLFWIIPFVYVLTVGLARIIAGAHFLSDVLFAILITFSATILFVYLLIQKPTKKDIKQ